MTPNMIGQAFANLAQRMIYTYLGTFPPCRPITSTCAGESAQRQMAGFLRGVLEAAYADPTVLDLPVIPDAVYDDGEMQKHRPELIKAMRAIHQRLLKFVATLEQIGAVGEVRDGRLFVATSRCRLTPKVLTQLDRVGLCHATDGEGVTLWHAACPELAPAWVLLSDITARHRDSLPCPYAGDAVLVFLHARFDPHSDQLSEAFATLSGDAQAFQAFENYCRTHGFQRAGNAAFRPGGSPDLIVSLTWCKPFAGTEVGGVQVRYAFTRRHQLQFEVRVPRFREIALRFDQLDDALQRLLVACCRPCNDCGYCIQTDRTRRQVLAFTADNAGATHRLCPVYPNLTWPSLDTITVAGMTRLLEYAEAMTRAEG